MSPRRQILIAFSVWLMAVGAVCQAEVGGPDTFGHVYRDSKAPEPREPYSWIEIDPDLGGSGTLILGPGGWHDTCVAVTLPFPFEYYGVQYTQANVSTNGILTLLAPDCSDPGGFIPLASPPNAVIAPFWDDLFPLGTTTAPIEELGKVYVEELGGEPHRRFVIEWSLVPHSLDLSSIHCFEIILIERVGEDDIKFQYRIEPSMEGLYTDGVNATIGIENETGADGLVYHQYDPYSPVGPVEDGLAIRFSTDLPSTVPALTGAGIALLVTFLTGIQILFRRKRDRRGG